jgi:hypothetical protein
LWNAHLEYRRSDWAERDRLAAGIAAWLTPTLARPLSALAERPTASKESAVQVGMADRTFYPARVRLVQMELVGPEGEGPGR